MSPLIRANASETLKALLVKTPALGHANYGLSFVLFVHETKGTALGLLPLATRMET